MRDSELESLRHVRRVQQLMIGVAENLLERARVHDVSKLSPPEADVFDEYTSKLKDVTYGSDEYKECLKGMKPALEHHYRMNRHHPEHWSNGICDMSLLDLIEMLVDWKAASERHTDGDVRRSIDINAERFGYTDDYRTIFLRTVNEMWPTHREPWHCFGCGAGGREGNFCDMCGAGKHDYERTEREVSNV
jgi:hypothetical protein